MAVLAGLLLGHSAFASCGMSAMDMPSQGPATDQTAMADEMAAQDTTADMDCCPKTHAPKCPLMALCSAPLAEHLVTIQVPAMVAAAYRQPEPVDEPRQAGLTSVPLPKPPRSTV